MSRSYLTKSLGYKGRIGKSTYRGSKPYGTFKAGGALIGGPSQGAITPGAYVPPPNNPGLQQPQTQQQQAQPNPQPITAPAGDPRDPTYWTNVGALNFAYNNAVAALGTRDVTASTKLSNQLAEFDRTQPIDTQHQRENYNNQGLFYSGHLGEAYGNLVADYARQRTGARDEFSAEHADYLTQLETLKGQLGIDIGREQTEADDRQIGRDTQSADNNTLSPEMAAIISAITGGNKPVVTGQSQQARTGEKPYRSVPHTNSQGVRGVLHIYPGGRKVFVRG